MLGDLGDARTPWMVDVFAGSADADYNKLDWSLLPSLPFHHSLSYVQHASSFVPRR